MEIRVYDTLPEDARQIRQEVFIEEQHFQEEFDGIDSRALHLVLYRDGSPAGTCRFFQGREPGAYLVGRIAVRKPFRDRTWEPRSWRQRSVRFGNGAAAASGCMPSREPRGFMRSRATLPTDRWSTKSTAPISGWKRNYREKKLCLCCPLAYKRFSRWSAAGSVRRDDFVDRFLHRLRSSFFALFHHGG